MPESDIISFLTLFSFLIIGIVLAFIKNSDV